MGTSKKELKAGVALAKEYFPGYQWTGVDGGPSVILLGQRGNFRIIVSDEFKTFSGKFCFHWVAIVKTNQELTIREALESLKDLVDEFCTELLEGLPRYQTQLKLDFLKQHKPEVAGNVVSLREAK